MNTDPATAALNAAAEKWWTDLTREGDPLRVPNLGRKGFNAGWRAALAAPMAAQEQDEQWRCFHCDECFTDSATAREHFGASEHDKPACQINIEHVRWLEEQHRLNCEEITPVMNGLRGLVSEHETLRRRAEEAGYARGLDDAKKHPEELGLTAAAPMAASAAPEPSEETKYDSWRVLGLFFKFWVGSALYDGSGAEVDLEEPYEAFRAVHAQATRPTSPQAAPKPFAWAKRTIESTDFDSLEFSANKQGGFNIPLFTFANSVSAENDAAIAQIHDRNAPSISQNDVRRVVEGLEKSARDFGLILLTDAFGNLTLAASPQAALPEAHRHNIHHAPEVLKALRNCQVEPWAAHVEVSKTLLDGAIVTLEAFMAASPQAADPARTLLLDLQLLWPELRQLVDGFTANSAWGSEWDLRTRQSMIDFGLRHLGASPQAASEDWPGGTGADTAESFIAEDHDRDAPPIDRHSFNRGWFAAHRNYETWRDGPRDADDRSMHPMLRRVLEGLSVSVDVSMSEATSGHRYFGTVTEVMDAPDDKCGVTLLVQDAEPNFKVAASPQAASAPLVEREAAKWREAEQSLGQAYIRLRSLIPGAFNTPNAPTAEQVWSHTEECLRAALAARASLPQAAAVEDVVAERRRQVEVEGWTPEHDDGHNQGEMGVAAAAYALEGQVFHELILEKLWPRTGWSQKWFRPKSRRANLIRAAALLLAEIERLDRALQAA